MSFECLIDPEKGPQWKGALPGSAEAFFLERGEFPVLLSGDETHGQFGVFTSEAPKGQLIPAHNMWLASADAASDALAGT